MYENHNAHSAKVNAVSEYRWTRRRALESLEKSSAFCVFIIPVGFERGRRFQAGLINF